MYRGVQVVVVSRFSENQQISFSGNCMLAGELSDTK